MKYQRTIKEKIKRECTAEAVEAWLDDLYASDCYGGIRVEEGDDPDTVNLTNIYTDETDNFIIEYAIEALKQCKSIDWDLIVDATGDIPDSDARKASEPIWNMLCDPFSTGTAA